jgi:hypothetical protein
LTKTTWFAAVANIRHHLYKQLEEALEESKENQKINSFKPDKNNFTTILKQY